DESSGLSVLVRRAGLLHLFSRCEGLSRVRLGIRHHDRVLPYHARQRLLLRAGLRDGVGSGRCYGGTPVLSLHYASKTQCCPEAGLFLYGCSLVSCCCCRSFCRFCPWTLS